ncbi:S-adenosyl-L-methionine-dependent methyltransferase [Truncatella angustata]|uniref:S-adenosyl-L-methionine-dependent methyltransferase n=1 Tax=Truncatella angustata TaxID=152316 RepID=A0A9P8UQD1_9PEZI|nr:S-adenosyl-L-methionine-dependent methyltransferase [Truncatella angustata]KAH6656318.1 S-adenosyl-L-methionine-dependent methyltransferase [Truncatella angustata]
MANEDLVSSGSVPNEQLNKENLAAWDSVAEYWDQTLQNGNDMYEECLLPTVRELVGLSPDGPSLGLTGQRALDLGTGSAVIAGELVKAGATMTAADGSQGMLEKARWRSAMLGLDMVFDVVDLMDSESLDAFATRHSEKFDIITISMTLKELADLNPLARALPKLLAPKGRVIIVNLHPVFSKPAGHRCIEVLENDETGKQELHRYIKVRRYLDIPPVRSEALRGQPKPLMLFHRPFWSVLEPFLQSGMVLDAMREPGFKGEPNGEQAAQAQNYHNFQQFPMLLAFRLRLAGS